MRVDFSRVCSRRGEVLPIRSDHGDCSGVCIACEGQDTTPTCAGHETGAYLKDEGLQEV